MYTYLSHPTPFLNETSFLCTFQNFRRGTGYSLLFSRSIIVPVPHLWIPAPHSMQHEDYSSALADSSAPFLCSIMAPALHWWIHIGFRLPTLMHCGSSVTSVDHNATFSSHAASGIRVSQSDWWLPAFHSYAASLFQRRAGVLQRPIPMPHYGSSAALVVSSAPLSFSIAVPAPH